MSDADLSNFLKALEDVKEDYTCRVCMELCKNPVTLSKCFHMICSEHFESLKACPVCNVSLEGCKTFYDDRLGPCVESTKKLSEMFEKSKEAKPASKQRGKKNVLSKKTETPENPDSQLSFSLTEDSRNRKRGRKETTQEELDSFKENKVNNAKVESKTIHNLSLMSTASSKGTKTLEKKNKKGETALHVACRLGKTETVESLLKQGANPNTKDNAGWTPLHEVVQNGRLDLVTLLLQYNTLINVPGQSNETPLHEAIRYNHKEIAEELVKNGADINTRNCKGETPMQLANKEMKELLQNAADNVIQTQTANITLISEIYQELDSEDIRVYCVSAYRTVISKLRALTKHHSNLHIEAKLTKRVTHIVVDAEDGVCQSSVDILQGIVSSLWILTTEWINKSNDEKLEPFQKYEVLGVGATTYRGPKNSRYNKYKQLPGIFDGCHFYLHNFGTKCEISKSMVLTKAVLAKIIADAGGVILRRAPNPESIPDSEKLVPYHAKKGGKLVNCAHYIIFKDIYEPMYNMQHLKALPIGWLIECIEKYELCEPW